MTDEQVRAIETPYEVQWWGRSCLCEPRAVQEPVEGGGRLISLTPLADRPNYYVLDVPVDWMSGEEDEDDHLEACCDAIEECYGSVDDVEYDEDGVILNLDWPALDTSCGVQWGTYSEGASREGP